MEDFEASLSIISQSMQQNTLWCNTNEANNFTIFRTPHIISESKKNLFKPSVISIGPFHRGEEHLQAMEEQKWRFLQDFLSRENHISLHICIKEMKLLEKETRRCYSETFDDLKSNEFVEMMLLDGCFVLEYFLKLCDKQKSKPMVDVGWNSSFIDRDLLLLDNQIPFFIVEKLFEIGLKHEDRTNFVKNLACYFLTLALAKDIDSIIPDPPAQIPVSIILDPRTEILDPPVEIPDSIIPDPPAQIPDSIIPDPPAQIPDSIIPNLPPKIPEPPIKIHHLVHLCYHYLVPNQVKPAVSSSNSFEIHHLVHRCYHYLVPNQEKPVVSSSNSFDPTRMASQNSTKSIREMVIPSATELKLKGLKFKPKIKPKHMLDILFEYGHGTLYIPTIAITDNTKPIFANLIAFEHSNHGNDHSPLASFVAFLDNLVNTPNDVKILQECEIIENWLGSEEELTDFINQVTESNVVSGDNYSEFYTEVNRYIGSRWNKHRAKLIRDYFSNPWAAISLVAAFILLVLTCVQSFYAIYAYYIPPSA